MGDVEPGKVTVPTVQYNDKTWVELDSMEAALMEASVIQDGLSPESIADLTEQLRR